MKQHLSKILSLAALAILFSFAACSEDDGGGGTVTPPSDLTQGNEQLVAAEVTVGGTDVISIEGTITEGFIMESGSSYWLNDIVEVVGSTLTVEPGTTVYANPDVPENAGVYLLINQGAKIEADGGNAAGLIRFTSGNVLVGGAATRDWGGIIIAGNGQINLGGTGQVEGVGAPYGGDNDADDSGTLRYVRIEYGGAFISASEDLNGLSLYGIGSGTTVEYVQVFEGGDDGIELYGGTVDLKHIVITNAQDDQLDYTNGWRGRAQFIAIVNSKTGDNGFEMDNLEGNETATPRSQPQISNVTMVNYNGAAGGEGVQLRRGTYGNFHNMLVIGYAPGVVVDGDESQGAVDTGDLVVANNGIFSSDPYSEWVANSEIPNENTLLDTEPVFTDGFVGVLAEADGVDPVDASVALDAWFDATDYVGAANPDGTAWWSGWALDVDGNTIN